VNSKPHIGFALEIIQADAIARWKEQEGKNVFYMTGTDEHGVKIHQTAKEKGTSTKALADDNAARFKKLAKSLNLRNDYFIRTSDKKVHWPGAQKMWKLLEKSGDIYKKKYSGKYCSGCEKYVTEKDLVNGKCPLHANRKLETIEEENYFFRLSKYEKRLQKLIEKDRYKIVPKSRKNEILSFIKEGLNDISFSRSRKNLPWGIPVPGDKEQVMYVWCDALSNYLSGIGFPNKKYEKWWPADVHVIGKDIIRFHAVYWPAMLLSAGIKVPRELFVHGFVTSEGQKMSKSLGNVVDPFKEIDKYGADAVRYFILREIPSTADGDYSQKAIITRINNELANSLGNLVSRSLKMIERFADGTVPKGKLKLKLSEKKAQQYMEKREIHKAIEAVWTEIGKVNEFITKKEPWTKPKDLNDILYTLAESLRWVSAATYAFVPEASKKIAKQIGLKKVPTFEELKKPIHPGLKIQKGSILFKKIDLKSSLLSQTMKVKSMIEFKDFEKVDIRIGKIVKAEDVPNSEKLIKMQVDFGGEKRQVLAGIRKWYKPKDLIGKKASFVVNLKPVKLMGYDSEAMILAAEKGKKVKFLAPESDIEEGAKIH